MIKQSYIGHMRNLANHGPNQSVIYEINDYDLQGTDRKATPTIVSQIKSYRACSAE